MNFMEYIYLSLRLLKILHSFYSVMHYLMPKRDILSLHSGCNIGKSGDVSLFFGLSGTHMPCENAMNVVVWYFLVS